jgi:hypothetical protein
MAGAACDRQRRGPAELATAKAMVGMAQALANDGADRAAGARGADQCHHGEAAAAATQGSETGYWICLEG